jgi:hypothetical protein
VSAPLTEELSRLAREAFEKWAFSAPVPSWATVQAAAWHGFKEGVRWYVEYAAAYERALVRQGEREGEHDG